MGATTLREALPTRRVEAWKYSDLRAALRDVALPDRPAPADGDVIVALAGDVETIVVGAGERRVITERFAGEGLDARASRIEVGPGASVERIVIQTGGGAPLSSCAVRLAEGARFAQVTLALGARLARLETTVSVEGAGAAVELAGAYLVGEGRHADLTTRVEHRAAGSTTMQLVKGVARPGGRGVFQGKIVVAEGAQKTDARQTHRALLLGEGAEIDAKPELEIYADDVQCAHGNTIGALDEAALFYLRSRGLPLAQARALLIEAFVLDSLPAWLDAAPHGEIHAAIDQWLRAAP
ncbi:MAG: SufD family Fe-S cluster assembly protein [Alphaproteobacteria bacterium]|nr:SufD family Fe-S cluster assembly protein [Alphaproteobacteria bacterium]